MFTINFTIEVAEVDRVDGEVYGGGSIFCATESDVFINVEKLKQSQDALKWWIYDENRNATMREAWGQNFTSICED